MQGLSKNRKSSTPPARVSEESRCNSNPPQRLEVIELYLDKFWERIDLLLATMF